MDIQTLEAENDQPVEKEEPLAEPEPRSKNRASGRKLFLGLGSIVLAVMLIAGFFWWQASKAHAVTDNAAVSGHIVPVSAKVSGTVVELNFQEGQAVKKGQILFRLDSRDYQVALRQAEAALVVARHQRGAAQENLVVTSGTTGSQVQESAAAVTQAQFGVQVARQELNAAQAGIVQQQEQIRTAGTRAEAARAQMINAQKNYQRMQTLYRQEFISRAELDNAETAYINARSQYDTARQQVREAQAALKTAQARVGQAQANLNQARGSVSQASAAMDRIQAQTGQVGVQREEVLAQGGRIEQAQAELEQARLNLSYTTVVSPISGIIGRKNVELGQVIQPNQPLLSIVPLEDVWIEANYKETDLRGIGIGSVAEVKIDAYPNRTFHGVVESIGAATGSQFSLLPPENASGNFVKVVQWIPLRIRLQGKNTQHLLRPGMSAEVNIHRKA